MNNTNFNFDWGVTSADHAFEGHQWNLVTTDDLVELCGAMDANALFAGGFGVFLSLLTLFYLRRWRKGFKPTLQNFCDKSLLSLIAMLFVVMIVRLLRAG